LRFTSPHPIGFRDDLVRAFAELPKLMPHVHLPLQSGSNRILKAMHRAYTAEKYFSLTEKLRAARPDIAMTTDVIVGFPGEKEEDHVATRELLERIGFDNAFIFRYSQRRDTPAAELGDQVPEAVKEERNQDILRVIDQSAIAKGEELVGRHVEILCEGPSKTNEERLTGRTPGNKIVIFEGSDRHVGEIFDVAVTRSSGFSLYGDPAVLGGELSVASAVA
jgi:tRNA-2-methylthio-N6-dimethylallyladenosine synthase